MVYYYGMLEIYLCTYVSFYKDADTSYIHLWFKSTRLSPQLNSTSRVVTTSVIHEHLLTATSILGTVYDPMYSSSDIYAYT